MLTRLQSIVFAVVGVALDRVFKYISIKNPSFEKGFFVKDNILGLKLHINHAFAWSLPVANDLIVVIVALILAILIISIIKTKALYQWKGLWLILLGAISNVFDRIVYGGVIDYIVVPWGGIINIADILIFVGVVYIICSKTKPKVVEA